MSLQLAEQFEANEQYEEAFREYKKEYEANPEDLGIMERLGHLCLILERPEEAAVYYHEILKRDITNPLAYDQLMSIYENTDKYKYYIYRGNKNSIENKIEFAINDFKKALGVASEDTQIVMTRLTIANLYRKIGNNLKAIDEFNIILEYPNLPEEIYLQLADIYLTDEVYSSAVDTLQRAKAAGYDTERVNNGLATVYLKDGNPQKAIEYTSDELLKIQCMLEMGDIDKAYEKLENLNEEYKKAPKYLILMAQYYYSSKDYGDALEYIDKYNEVVPNSPLTYQMRALVYDACDDDYSAHLNWGKYNITRNNIDIAINELLNAVQIDASDIDLLFTLADLLTDTGEVNHAAEYYEKILKLDDSNIEALKKLAKFREGIGDYRTQAQYLEKLVEIEPRNLGYLKNLAHAYERSKARAKAIKVYTQYIELEKDPVDLRMAKDRLERLTGAGSSDGDSVGLIDKIMGLFNK